MTDKWPSRILTKFILHTEKKITAGKMNLKTNERKTDSSSFVREKKRKEKKTKTIYNNNFINKASKLYPNLNKYPKTEKENKTG